MQQRYYIESFFHHWVIKDMEDESFLFGPFESEADAYFTMQMANGGKLHFSKGDGYGEKSIEEPNAIY